MGRWDNSRALRKIKKHARQARELIDATCNSDEAEEWKQSAAALLQQLFGKDHGLFEEFSRIGLKSTLTYKHQAVVAGSQQERDRDKAICMDGLDESIKVLTKCRSYIDAYDVPIPLPARHGYLRTIAVPVIVGLIFYMLGLYTDQIKILLGISVQEELTNSIENGQSRVTEVNFYNRLEEFDANLKYGYDSLLQATNREIGLESGASAYVIAKFFSKARMRRDNMIDSFVVTYETQGGCPDSLKFQRKLPVSAFPMLKKRFPGIHQVNELRYLGLDTL